MSKSPNDLPEASQGHRLQDWWRELPVSYRINAVLYALGGMALCFLLFTLLSDDGAPQVQVGAGGPVTTVPPTAATVPTTLRPSGGSTSLPAGGSTSSTVAGTGGSTSSTARAGTATTGGGGGGGGGGGTTTSRPPDTTGAPATTTTVPEQPTTSRFDCVNSANPLCGSFSFFPAPSANQPLTIAVTPNKTAAKVGEEITFSVVATDPDHTVTANCSEVRFSGGGSADGPCSPPPDCPPRYGPWTPPAATPGQYTNVYKFTWTAAGDQSATFRFRSWSSDRCLGLDPYASEMVVSIPITITPGT